MDIETTILAVLIIFTASIVRSTFGFGDALIAMPLLSIIISTKTASPVVALAAIFIAVSIIAKDWKKARFKGFWRLMLPILIGIPIGILFLTNSHEALIKTLLGALLISFSLFQLINPKLLTLKSDIFAPFFGIISGMFGGAYNTNGPPIIIYGTLRQWEASEFRIILQVIFFPTNVFIVLGHGIAGLWTNQAMLLMAYAFIPILIAISLGSYIHSRIAPEKFVKYIYILLIGIGSILILKTIL